MWNGHLFRHMSCVISSWHPGLPRLRLRSSFSYQFAGFASRRAGQDRRRYPLITIPLVSTYTSFPRYSLYAPDELPETVTTELYASPYISARLHCSRDVSDNFSEALLCFGASSISVDEDNHHKDSNEVCINCIFTDCQDVDACIPQAAAAIGLKEIPRYEVNMGEECDWMKKFQDSFYPVEITEGLWVVPKWRTPPDVKARNIILNPGLAFGTGEHPTTKLCLLLLLGLIKGGEVILDYGTGSGILAIAAIKFGARFAVGVDIDPQAIASARQNAVLNNIGPEKTQFHLPPSKTSSLYVDGTVEVEKESSHGLEINLEAEKFDIVIANILLNPLLDLADYIVSYAKPGAVVGVSGILSEQVPYVINRYSPYLQDVMVSEMDNWACVSGKKKMNITES